MIVPVTRRGRGRKKERGEEYAVGWWDGNEGGGRKGRARGQKSRGRGHK